MERGSDILELKRSGNFETERDRETETGLGRAVDRQCASHVALTRLVRFWQVLGMQMIHWSRKDG